MMKDSYQTSTNGSYVASFGCDGDMDTFSLTNNAVNQSWSITLTTTITIVWIFVSIGTGGECYVICFFSPFPISSFRKIYKKIYTKCHSLSDKVNKK